MQVSAQLELGFRESCQYLADEHGENVDPGFQFSWNSALVNLGDAWLTEYNWGW